MRLHKLSKNCAFKMVTAKHYREEFVRDTFSNGLASSIICQRLLKNYNLDLQAAYRKASSINLVQKNSDVYNYMLMDYIAAATTTATTVPKEIQREENCTSALSNLHCK